MAKTTNLQTETGEQHPPENEGHIPMKEKAPGGGQIRAMGCSLILFGLLLIYLFLVFWPAGLDQNAKGNELQPINLINLFGKRIVIKVMLDVQLLLLVMLAGGLGSFVHTATSFGDYVGNHTLAKSWFWWYILRPFIGMALSVVFYLVVRGGFLSAGTSAGNINPFGIAALAGLVGMFSKQATDKLDEVFTTLFRTAPGSGDAKRKDNLANPLPSINDVEPRTIEPLTENVVITIKGTGFVKGSAVRINGTNRETEFIDESKVIAKLVQEDVQKEGELDLTIFNPPPGGGESTPIKLKIEPKKIIA